MRINNTVSIKKLISYKKKSDYSEIIQSYAMLAPQILGFLIFTIYPIMWVYRYAFFDYDGVKAVYSGLDNFVRIFTRDKLYWDSLTNTFVLAFGKLIIELPLALIIAVFLNKKIFGRSFFRTMFFMPNIVSTAIIGLIFTFIFSSFNGIANNFIMEIGIIDEPINWFAHKWTSMTVIILASIWQGFGINMLFFLAGLQNVPEELYEAAKIDGATGTHQFIHITLPMLAPIAQIILMLAIVNGMKVMDLVMVLTNGMPAGETEVVMLHIYKYFFPSGYSNPQLGYASSMGLVTSVIIGIVTMMYLKLSKKVNSTY